MKKHITLLSCLCLASGFYAQGLKVSPKIAKEISTQKPVVQHNATPKALGAEVWSDDFSTPANWTINNSGQTGPTFGWNINATADGWWTDEPLASSSEGNFAELLNGDPSQDPGTQALNVVYTLTTAAPIDITGEGTDLLLQFEQFGALFNDLQEFQISPNGTTWTSVGNNTAKGTLSAGGGSQYDDPDYVSVNLSSYLEAASWGGSTNLYLRFRWTTRFPAEAGEPGVWIAYTWMIDDVAITQLADYDLRLTNDYWGSEGLGYHMIPESQLAPLEFTATVKNEGADDLTNVQLNVNITGAAAFTGTSPATTIESQDVDSLVLSTTFTPATVGTYTVARSLTMAEADDVTHNDNLDGFTFSVGGYLYARDNNVPDGYSNNQADGYEVGNFFDIWETVTAKAVNVRLATGTVTSGAGQANIYARIYPVVDGDFGDPYETDIIDVVSANVNNNNFKILLDDIELEPGTYLVMVGTFDAGLRVANAGYSPNQTSFFLDGNDIVDDDLFFQNETPMVRLNFDPTLAVNELELATDVNVAPNPFSNETAVNFTLKADAEVSVAVTDLSGRVVLSVPASQMAAGNQSIAIDGSAFSAGVYNYTLTVGGNSTTKRIVKK